MGGQGGQGRSLLEEMIARKNAAKSSSSFEPISSPAIGEQIARKNQEKEQPGFFEYMGNRLENFVLYAQNRLNPDISFDNDPERQQRLDRIRMSMEASRAMTGSGFEIAMNDMANMFSKTFDNIGEQLLNVAKSPLEFGKQIVTHPINTLGILATELTRPIGDLSDSLTGIDMNNEFATPLSPEEKAKRIKNVAATVAMFGAGAAVGSTLKTARAGRTVSRAVRGEPVSTGALIQATKAGEGVLASQIRKGVAEGAAAGITYSSLRFANEDDQLTEILTNGIVFAPLGIAWEVLRYPKVAVKAEQIADVAGKLRDLRSIQTLRTLDDGTRVVDALKRANDISEVAYHGTGKAFDEFDPQTQKARALYGPGFYFTDNPDVAAGYALSRSGVKPITRAKTFENPFDFSKNFTLNETRNILGKITQDDLRPGVKRDPAKFENIKASDIGEIKRGDMSGQDIISYIADHLDLTKGTNVFDSTYEILSRSGFDSIKTFGDPKVTPNVHKAGLKFKKPFRMGETIKGDEILPIKTKMLDHYEFLKRELAEQERLFAESEKSGYTSPNAEEILQELKDRIQSTGNILAQVEVGLGKNSLTLHQGSPSLYTRLVHSLGGKAETQKFLKSLGYDAITHTGGHISGGDIHNVTIVFDKDQITSAFGKSPIIKPTSAIGELITQKYNTWKTNRIADYAKRFKMARDIGDMIEIDGFDYNKTFKELLGSDVPPALVEPAIEHMARLFHDDLAKTGYLDSGDKAVIDNIRKMAALEDVTPTYENIAREVRAKGLDIVRGEAGTVQILDFETKKPIVTLKSFEDARSFAQQVGEPPSNGLDNLAGGQLPPIHGAMDLATPPNPDQPGTPAIYGKESRLSRLMDEFSSHGAVVTKMREVMMGTDNVIRRAIGRPIELYTNVWTKTQEAKRKVISQTNNILEVARKTVEPKLRKMKWREREQILHLMEFEEAPVLARKWRLNEEELAFAEKYKGTGKDFANIYKYNRARDRIAKEFAVDSDSYNIKLAEEARGLGLDAEHIKIADQFDQSAKDFNGGQVLAYMRALEDGRTLGQFITDNKITPEQIQIAAELNKLIQDFSDVHTTGVDYGARYNAVLANARLYHNGSISAASHAFGGAKDLAFYRKMARSGNLSAKVTDPLIHYQQIVSSGVDAYGLIDTIQEARAWLKKNIHENKEIPQNMRRRTMRNSMRYLNDIAGRAGSMDKTVQSWIDSSLEIFGIKKQIDVRRLVNAMAVLAENAAQGMRLKAGVRDFNTGASFVFARFDSKRLARVIRFGTRGLEYENQLFKPSEMEAAGIIPGLSPNYFEAPMELTPQTAEGSVGSIGSMYHNYNQAAFFMSMQPSVYKMFHAGTYLDVFDLSSRGLRKYRDGNWTKEQLGESLKIDTYDQPVIDTYFKMIDEGLDEGATRFLAKETGYEMVGVFGLGNHPAYWNSVPGRLVGQFGQWPMWYRNALMRLAGRGTNKQRMAAVTKFVASQKAIVLAGAAAGFNVNDWQMDLGDMVFGGGPALDYYEAFSDAVSPYDFLQQRGRSRLRQLLPYDPGSGRFQPGQLYIPTGLFFRDLQMASEMWADEEDPHVMLGRAIGFREYTAEEERETLVRSFGLLGQDEQRIARLLGILD